MELFSLSTVQHEATSVFLLNYYCSCYDIHPLFLASLLSKQRNSDVSCFCTASLPLFPVYLDIKLSGIILKDFVLMSGIHYCEYLANLLSQFSLAFNIGCFCIVDEAWFK